MRKFRLTNEWLKLLRAVAWIDKRKTALVVAVKGRYYVIAPTDGLWLYVGRLNGEYCDAVFSTRDLVHVPVGAQVWSFGGTTFFVGNGVEYSVASPRVEVDWEYVESLLKVRKEIPLSPAIYDLINLKNVYNQALLSSSSVITWVVSPEEYAIYVAGEGVRRINLKKWCDVTDLVLLRRVGTKYIYVGIGWLFRRWLRILKKLAPNGCWLSADGNDTVRFRGQDYLLISSLITGLHEVGGEVSGALVLAGLRPMNEFLDWVSGKTQNSLLKNSVRR